MDKVYLVMMFNYPYAIFENMNDAINSCKEHVQKFGPRPMFVQAYTINGTQNGNITWANWWKEMQDE
jgi:hypothetical protein